MATIKRGKWIQAKRFRVTKKNGRTVIEVQRTVKRKSRTNLSRRKTKKAADKSWDSWMGRKGPASSHGVKKAEKRYRKTKRLGVRR